MRRFILVAGVDYEFKGVDFRVLSDNRMKRLIAANRAKEDLSVVTLDVRKGEVTTVAVTYPSGTAKQDKKTVKPFDAVTKASYEDHGGHIRLKDGLTGVMSITDIYDAIRTIGADHPGELREFSVFSHSWIGGPLLVNTDDDRIAPAQGPTRPGDPRPEAVLTGTMRDPDDKDPRSEYDFVAPTMNAADLAVFTKAFHKEGIAWFWGCVFPRNTHEILTKIERSKGYADSGVADDTPLTVNDLTKDHLEYINGALQSIVGALRGATQTLAFKYWKYYFCTKIQASYAYQFAQAARVITYAGVPATYAEYDQAGKLPLMNVANVFSKHLAFYKSYFGFTYDPEGRRYGAYQPAFTCARPTPPAKAAP